MLSYLWWRFKRLLIGPAYGKHSYLNERPQGRRNAEEFWDAYDEEDTWLPEDEPESDPYFRVRQTRMEHALTYESYDWPPPVDREAAWVRPYVRK